MQRLLKTCIKPNVLCSRLRYNAAYTTATLNPLVTQYKQQLSENNQQVWQTYETLKSKTLLSDLKREDFLKLRSNLWTSKGNWGTESRILQVLDDMKTAGLTWTISEYNEYFIAKLFQAQHQDILTLFNKDFSKNGLKLSAGSFNVILATYVQLGLMDEAVELVKEASTKWDVVPDLLYFDRTMNRCMPKNSTVVQTARDLIKEHGLGSTKTLNANLAHLFKEKRLQDIKWLLQSLKDKKLDLSTYSILIKGYADSRLTSESLKVYQDMKSKDVKPNRYVCSSMLEIFAHTRDVVSAEQLVRDTVLGGHKPDEVLYNQLIKVYFKARLSQKAFRAFQEVEKDPTLKVNDVILNTMINGLVINRELKIAGLLYDSMVKSNLKPDMITFNTMLKGYVKANDMESAQKIILDMFKFKMEPDTVTYTTLIDSIFMTRQPQTTSEILKYIEHIKIQPNVYTFNAIMNGWIKQHHMEEAEATFNLMFKHNIKPTIHTWTNLIQGYVETMNLGKTIETFQSLLRSGTQPDRATFNFMIVGFINHGRLSDAYTCLEHMRSIQLSPTKDTWKLMLDDCASRKDWVTGKKVVALMDASGFVISSDSLRRPYNLVKSQCI
ncbi:hypothetical protein BDF21DRAFT_433570 [Thamnidium elegans]|nr:hypothetical protein BDF21DRAFT_433570 [Thamnidium elegans]